MRADQPLPVGGRHDGVKRYTALRSAAVVGDAAAAEGGALETVETRSALSSVAYFEITISNELGSKQVDTKAVDEDEDEDAVRSCVSIGLATRRFVLYGRQPGWDKHSLGYHGDDGNLYHGSGRSGRRFGPRFGAGDTVGCGVNLPTRQVFFTLNGAFIGVAFSLPPPLKDARDIGGLPLGLFPAVGIDTNEKVSLNIGHAPFAYDPDGAAAARVLARHARDSALLAFFSPPATFNAANLPVGSHPEEGGGRRRRPPPRR